MALLHQPFGDGGMDRFEDRIARDHGEDVVELDVRPLELGKIAEGLPVGLQRVAQIAQIPLGRMLRRVAREAHLEERPRLLEMPHAVRLGEHIARAARQRLDHDLRCRPDGARPAAGAQFDQPHPLQMEQRLAHRRTPDAELAHQIALRRQLVAGRHILVPDALLQVLGDILVQLAAANDGHRLVYLSYQFGQNANGVAKQSQFGKFNFATAK